MEERNIHFPPYYTIANSAFIRLQNYLQDCCNKYWMAFILNYHKYKS